MTRPDTFFNLADLSEGIARNLAPGVDTRVFPGDQAAGPAGATDSGRS